MSQKRYSKQIKSNIDNKWTTVAPATLTDEEAEILNASTVQTGVKYVIDKAQGQSPNQKGNK